MLDMPVSASLVGQGHPVLSEVSASRSARAALMDITERPDEVCSRGDGSWLWDARGRRHLDFVQGWAVEHTRPCAGLHP
jgi:acetylornithine/succinyldiaminopimelate/putrescine aminotransferase